MPDITSPSPQFRSPRSPMAYSSAAPLTSSTELPFGISSTHSPKCAKARKLYQHHLIFAVKTSSILTCPLPAGRPAATLAIPVFYRCRLILFILLQRFPFFRATSFFEAPSNFVITFFLFFSRNVSSNSC